MTIELKPKDYKSDIKPVWCPGCGHFAILSALTKALAYLKIPKHQIGFISVKFQSGLCPTAFKLTAKPTLKQMIKQKLRQ